MRGACLVYRVPGAPFNGRRGIQYKKPHNICGFLSYYAPRRSRGVRNTKKAPPPARRGVKGVQRMFIQAVILLRPAFQFFPQDA